MRDRTITCPSGQVEPIDLGADIEFEPHACARCHLRSKCTTAAAGHGRTVTIADDELLQHRLRKLISTPKGRERLRERIPIEHCQGVHPPERRSVRAPAGLDLGEDSRAWIPVPCRHMS